jgi:hypothetical protein
VVDHEDRRRIRRQQVQADDIEASPPPHHWGGDGHYGTVGPGYGVGGHPVTIVQTEAGVQTGSSIGYE